MGKENDVILEFLRNDLRFADLFNGGLFAGECVVNATELEEAGENYTEFRDETAKTGTKAKNIVNQSTKAAPFGRANFPTMGCV